MPIKLEAKATIDGKSVVREATGALPRAYFARRRATRLREVQATWPDGLLEPPGSRTLAES